jgi:hypothetical protein
MRDNTATASIINSNPMLTPLRFGELCDDDELIAEVDDESK